MGTMHQTGSGHSVDSGRPRRRLPLAALAGVALLASGTLAGVSPLTSGVATQAGAASPASSAPSLTVPTADGHTFRKGAVPRITTPAAAASVRASLHASALVSTAGLKAAGRNLTYGGGTTATGGGQSSGIVNQGVMAGQPKLYLVFFGGQWGSITGGTQWGTSGTSASGDVTFSNDPNGEATMLQKLFGGLGTNGETWSTTLTQYCQAVPLGTEFCNPTSQNVPYPTAPPLAGVWFDDSSTASLETAAGATGNQLAAEAEAAAAHFGNTTQSQNANTQYVIASPTGTNPDGWANSGTGYCAYHDDTNDPAIDGGGAVAGPILPWTNLPYVPDAGYQCGAGSVNSPGLLDGAGEAASHEYAETITDAYPETTVPGGWTDGGGNEIGDTCAYVTGAGAAFNLNLATGSVPVQGLWSNQANGGKGGCVQTSSPFTYAPTLTSVPAKSTVGTRINIVGTNLGDVTSVTIGGAAATIDSETNLVDQVTVPTGAATGSVVVTNPGGSVTWKKTFTLAPSIVSLSSSSVSVGGVLTINGYGFTSIKSVTVGRGKVTVASSIPDQIQVTITKKAMSGSVVVTTKGGAATAPGSLTVS